jgi:hypothetical protein
MRRIAVITLLVLAAVALVVGWRIWTRPPALVVSPRALSEVANVEYRGPQTKQGKMTDFS